MKAGQLVISLAGIVVVIVACYYATYYIGTKASGRGGVRNKGRNITILDRFSISKDKSFYIIEIAGKVYVVGITNQSMTLIDTLDPEAFAEQTAQKTGSQTWYTAPGGRLGGKIFNSLASFMAARTGKTRGTGDSADVGSGTFADSMNSAREKNASGQPDRDQAERTEDPDGEE